ncbi:Mrp/NBP35 family ATP-binding protein [Eggerthellaceae bacterium zg-997]|nr:Mrp/NBP35 family ATP-binding protein [Eggerthellaceae bacterium zg-997]
MTDSGSACGSGCSSCGVSGCGSRTEEPAAATEPQRTARSQVKHVIGVVSGKGGVGKSLVTSLLASEMRRRGHKVGILDADITGPSIPKAFGISARVSADSDGINPSTTESGIKVMSVNLMLPQDDMPVAWRGPVITGILKQFWEETNWEDLDYLFLDMPPGTSDVFLTIMQSFPLDGIVTVSAPQELVAMIVGKAVNLAHQMSVPVLGLVENMAFFKCDGCDKEHFIFGDPQGKFVANRYQIPAFATLPLDPRFARLCDQGKIEQYDVEGRLDEVIEQIQIAARLAEAKKAQEEDA